MTSTVQRAAMAAIVTRINELYPAMKAAATRASEATIEGVNLGRELGLCFQEMCSHEQMTLQFFQNHADQLPKEMDFGFVQRCEWMARNIKGPVKSLAEVRKAEQQLFYAFDLIEEPKRLEQQSAKGSQSPVAWWLSTFSGVEAEWKRQSTATARLDDFAKSSLKEQMNRHIALVAQWRDSL